MNREQDPQRCEMHVNGALFRMDSGIPRFLCCLRTAERSLFPLTWEIGCGGQLRPDESFEYAVQRHFNWDLGIKVDTLAVFHSLYEIRKDDGTVIPGVRMLCRWLDEQPEPRSPNYDRFVWMHEHEMRSLERDFIPGSIDAALSLFLRARRVLSWVP